MAKRIGQFTREDHEHGVMDAYARNIAQGMDEETAMTEAGKQWRARIEAQGAKEIAGVMKFLGMKQH